MAGVSADVFEQYLHPFLYEAEPFGECGPYLAAVDIPVYGAQRGDIRQFFRYGHGAYIPGVPYLVGLAGVFQDGFVDSTVSVGEQEYLFHGVKLPVFRFFCPFRRCFIVSRLLSLC